jgi:hypothetical protein
MIQLHGLEDIAFERVAELRMQGDHARFLRTLPRTDKAEKHPVSAFVAMFVEFLSTRVEYTASSAMSERMKSKAEGRGDAQLA